ncbi:MAG: flavin oxidoreductase [Flavobacteriaceae bacterium]|nr:flavin oxidoreductase [Flavobacteriaceae bacterium]|tara:strand:+ start:6199 stop:6822 length:624 start_codon:yes stop_codon:yes gene_type:complete
MKYFNTNDIQAMSKIFRLNLINSITGYKSANLIVTKTNSKIYNVAIFSSVTHLGSDPPLIGFITRPGPVPRNTYDNIIENGYFTINHITKNQIESAHHSSAKYPKNISEFDKTTLSPEFKENFVIPFVKNSPIQIACSFSNEYHITENNTKLIIGRIENLFLNENLLNKDGWVELNKGEIVTINGLDGYALPKLIKRFSYARPKIKK